MTWESCTLIKWSCRHTKKKATFKDDMSFLDAFDLSFHLILFVILVFSPRYEVPLDWNGEEQTDVEEGDEHFCHPFMIDMLLERHKISIPNHEPKLYCSAAAGTRSVPGFNILSFPDFWGHVPPPGRESMAQRKSSVQRYKDFIDWHWQMCWVLQAIELTKQPIRAVRQFGVLDGSVSR